MTAIKVKAIVIHDIGIIFIFIAIIILGDNNTALAD